ncbi:MAG: hypothetical protein HZA51_02120 [Planctomycetes bacterium]|nr:hypothetical protein [Planctomycetota bacterium]
MDGEPMMRWKRDIMLALTLLALIGWSGFADEPDKSGPNDKRTISLNIKKGEIGDALRLVAEQGGLNLVIGPEVKGEVSVYLTEATLETALKAIAQNNGFAYSMNDTVISVAKASDKTGPEVTPPVITRIFTLRSQDAERVKDALEFALSKWGKMKVLNQNSQGGYGVQRLSSLGGDLNGSGSSGGGASGGSFNNNGRSSGFGGASGLSGGPAQQQQPMTQDSARNARTLVVTDLPENLELISGLIADLDRLPPQVLIEARIVEMSTDLQRRLGIDWNISALANGPVLNHGWPLRNSAGFASGSQIQRTFTGAPYQTAGLALGTVDFSQFTALVQANQSDTAIRLLANPRLLVYNNHSASILVGERYPILQANISNFGTATESLQTYIPVGVQLEVTPTIMMDGAISLLVHPATSALGDDVVGTTGLHVARIRTRELDTRVIMQDGQTIVLGGLISDRKTHQANKVPGLGDVPVLDWVFRQESPRSERVDLLIFLTAHVENATQVTERDQKVYDMYKPHFKHVERLQDVPLHFEIPTEYEPPKPMFTDPPASHDGDEEMSESTDEDASPAKNEASQPAKTGSMKRPPVIREETSKTKPVANAESETDSRAEVEEVPGMPDDEPAAKGLNYPEMEPVGPPVSANTNPYRVYGPLIYALTGSDLLEE